MHWGQKTRIILHRGKIRGKIYPHLFQLSIAVFVHIFWIGLANGSTDEILNLDRRFRAIRYAATNVHSELAELESECLNLIPDHNSPADKGKIYATMAFLYSDRGYGPDDDPNMAGKAYQYSMMALDYPLEPMTACYMYSRGSDAIVARLSHDPNTPIVGGRETAIDLCLKGLKHALDNEAPNECQKSPGPLRRYGVAPGAPLRRFTQWNNPQIEARERWLYETEFCGLRRGLFDRCLSLYSHQPYDRDTFESKVRQTLKGYDQTAGELIAALHTIEKLEE